MDGKSLDIVTEKLGQLKGLFPDIFAENQIDLARLKEILGEEVFVQNEHYELSWAGKSEARREIQKQTTATLTPDRSGSVNFGSTQNVFIEGENLEALRVLQKSYFGKIKMIYIDPPYNTGNDSFVYPDDYSERSDEFNKRTGITDENGFLNKQDLWQKNNKENGRFHSVWLSMMYPRLYLARNLLREDGVIFISIDDNEASNLKLICDEVFGEENFIAQIIVQSNKRGQTYKEIAKTHEYLYMYSKSENYELFELEKELDSSLPYEDERGRFDLWELRNRNPKFGKFNRPNLYFPIFIDPNSINENGYANISLNQSKEFNEETYPLNSEGLESCWRWGKDKVSKEMSDLIAKKTKSGKWNIYEKSRKSTTKAKSLWTETSIISEQGTIELGKLNLSNFFDHPKPVDLIKKSLRIATQNSDLVLDFFAGSGTTAQAVMELNEEDGGNRQFTCVQMPEVLEENSEAYKSGYKTIADITKARISKVIEKITTERESKLELETRQPLGFNAYKLAPSNFKIWRSDIQGKDAILEQLQVFQSSEKSDSPQENMLTELLLKTGLGLGVKYFQEQSFYKVGNLWICFEKFQPEMKEQILQGNVQKVIFLNSCFASDAELSNLQLELKENEINLVII